MESSDVNVLPREDDDMAMLIDTGTDEVTGLDRYTAATWIYPVNYPVRDYQKNIVSKALFTNTLVTLPTGLGKTFIAAVVMYNFHRWFPGHKVVFMAHSRPLVSQQVEACAQIMGMPSSVIAHLNGSVSLNSRKLQWETKRIFFLTPQVFNNDLTRGLVAPESIRCIVIDEAHKALGNQAFCQAVRSLSPFNSMFRVLALSATPGDDIPTVRKVIENLMISHLELRTEDDEDIKKYLHTKQVDNVVVGLDSTILDYKNRLLKVSEKYLRQLTNAKALSGSYGSISSFSLLLKQKQFIGNPSVPSDQRGLVLSNFSVVISMFKAIEELVVHGLRSLHNKLLAMKTGDGSKSNTHHRLAKDDEFLSVIDALESYIGVDKDIAFDPDMSMARLQDELDAQAGGASKPLVYSHPKFVMLEEIVTGHFQEWSQRNESTRVIVFCKARSCTGEICNFLNRFRPLIMPMVLIGQSQSKSGSGSTNRGLKQSAQLEVMRKFREGQYNTLVATCVGEEGLDVGEVDLIVNFDATRNSNTQVQRSGRTGRKRDGRVVNLLTEGKEQQDYNMSVSKSSTVNRKLLQGIKSLPLIPGCRLIPNEIQPRCQEMCLGLSEKAPASKKPSASSSSTNELTSDSSSSVPFVAARPKDDKPKIRKPRASKKNAPVLSQASQVKYDIRYAMDKAREKSKMTMTQEMSDFSSSFREPKNFVVSHGSGTAEVICLDDSFEKMPVGKNVPCGRKILEDVMNAVDDNCEALNELDKLSMDELVALVSANEDLVRVPERFLNCRERLHHLPRNDNFAAMFESSDLEEIPLPFEIDESKFIAEKTEYMNGLDENGEQKNKPTAVVSKRPSFVSEKPNSTWKATANILPEKTETKEHAAAKAFEIKLNEIPQPSFLEKSCLKVAPTIASKNLHPVVTQQDVNSLKTTHPTNFETRCGEVNLWVAQKKTTPAVVDRTICPVSKTDSSVTSKPSGVNLLSLTQALEVVAEYTRNSECNDKPSEKPVSVQKNVFEGNGKMRKSNVVPGDITIIPESPEMKDMEAKTRPKQTAVVLPRQKIDEYRPSSSKNDLSHGILPKPAVNSVRSPSKASQCLDDTSPSLISSGVISRRSTKVKKSLQFDEPPKPTFRPLSLDSDDDLFAEEEGQRNTQKKTETQHVVEDAADVLTQLYRYEVSPVISSMEEVSKEPSTSALKLNRSEVLTQLYAPNVSPVIGDVEGVSFLDELPTSKSGLDLNIQLDAEKLQESLVEKEKLTPQDMKTDKITFDCFDSTFFASPIETAVRPKSPEVQSIRPSQRNKPKEKSLIQSDSDDDDGWISMAKRPALPLLCLPSKATKQKTIPNKNTQPITKFVSRVNASSGLQKKRHRVAPLANKPSTTASAFDVFPDELEDLLMSPIEKKTVPSVITTPCSSKLRNSFNQSTPFGKSSQDDEELSDGALEAIRAVEVASLAERTKEPAVLVISSSDSELSDGALEAIKAVEKFEKTVKNDTKKCPEVTIPQVATSQPGNVSVRSEEPVFRLWSSDEDDCFQNKPTTSRPAKISTPPRKKSKPPKKKKANPFLDDEAVLSGSSGSGDGSSSGMDEMDSSFLDERLAPTQAPGIDMTAKYLSDIKSPRVVPGAFKISAAPGNMDINVFSQVVQNDEDYMQDSFCVADATELCDEPLSELELAEMRLEQQRKRRRRGESPLAVKTPEATTAVPSKKKRKRVMLLDSSSDEDGENERPSKNPAARSSMVPPPPVLKTPASSSSFVSSFARPQAMNVTETRLPVPSNDQRLILIGSRSIASAPEVTIALRAKFKYKVDVRSSPGADYIVGWRLGINRITLSDFCNGSPATSTSIRESTQKLTSLFLKPVLIVEDDKNKSAPKTAGCHVNMWAKNSAKRAARLALAGVFVFFTKDKDESAEVIAKLAEDECSKGHGVVTVFKDITPALHERLKFYTSLPGVNIAMALGLCQKFSTLKSMLLVCDSLPNIRTHFGVSRADAIKILRILEFPR